MEPNFELSIIRRRDGKLLSVDKVYGDDMIELLSKTLILVIQIRNLEVAELAEKKMLLDDDIPF